MNYHSKRSEMESFQGVSLVTHHQGGRASYISAVSSPGHWLILLVFSPPISKMVATVPGMPCHHNVQKEKTPSPCLFLRLWKTRRELLSEPPYHLQPELGHAPHS